MGNYPRLRVKALQDKRRRAGLEFTREAQDFTPDELAPKLGGGLTAVIALGAILTDPLLSVVLVELGEGGEIERPVTDEERVELTAFLEAQGDAEASKVDPTDPPTPDAAENSSAASGDAAADPAPTPTDKAPAAPAPADAAPAEPAADKPAKIQRAGRTSR